MQSVKVHITLPFRRVSSDSCALAAQRKSVAITEVLLLCSTRSRMFLVLLLKLELRNYM